MPNCLEYVVAFFAITLVGGVVCPVDSRWAHAELDRVVRFVEPRVIVSRPATSGNAAVTIDSMLSLAESLPEPTIVLSVELHGHGPALDRDRVALRDASDPAATFFTSGTGGTPQAVVHSNSTIMACVNALKSTRRQHLSFRPSALYQLARVAMRYRGRLGRVLLGRNVLLTPLAFSSIAGHTILLQAILSGETLVLVERFDPRSLLQLIETERVTYLAVNPTMAELCLRVRDLDRFDLKSLFVVGVGGSHASPDLAKRIRSRLGCGVALGYGSTELGGGVLASTMFDPEDAQVRTVGRPFPGTEVRVVDAANQPVAVGHVGELAVRSSGLMLGYESPGETASHVDNAGWYHTGDLAVVDQLGYVSIVGRVRELIIRSGQNVYPGEIEEVLEGHPSVDRAAVVGVPDGLAGEMIWAFVTSRDGVDLDASEVVRFCRGRVSPLKTPDRVSVLRELPIAGDGKVKKHELRRAALLAVQNAVPASMDS